MTTTKPILYYFDIPGRGDAIRLSFHIGHIDFDDFRVPIEEWMTKYKPLMPARQLPVLELNGIKYCESPAILIYVAKRAGLVPEDSEAMLAMFQAIDGLERVAELLPPLRQAEPEEFGQLLKVQGGKAHERFAAYGDMIGRTQHERGFIAGDKLSAADLALYAAIKHFRSRFIGFPRNVKLSLPQDFADDIPAIKRVLDLVETIPEVREYYSH